MSLVSLSLVVLAAFIHVTWNLLAKRAAAAGAAFVFASKATKQSMVQHAVAWIASLRSQ
jgi:hypothetical protein